MASQLAGKGRGRRFDEVRQVKFERTLIQIAKEDFDRLPSPFYGFPVYVCVMPDGEIKIWPRMSEKPPLFHVSYSFHTDDEEEARDALEAV